MDSGPVSGKIRATGLFVLHCILHIARAMFRLITHLIVKNASQMHMLEPLPQLRVKLARAFFIRGGRYGHRRTAVDRDLGSFEQLRNPDNFPRRLYGDAFPVHDSRDAVGGLVNEDVVSGIVVEKGTGFCIAGGPGGEKSGERRAETRRRRWRLQTWKCHLRRTRRLCSRQSSGSWWRKCGDGGGRSDNWRKSRTRHGHCVDRGDRRKRKGWSI